MARFEFDDQDDEQVYRIIIELPKEEHGQTAHIAVNGEHVLRLVISSRHFVSVYRWGKTLGEDGWVHATNIRMPNP